MKKGTKILLITALALVFIGGMTVAIAFIAGGSLDLVETKEVKHTANGDFSEISVSVGAADIFVKGSEGSEYYAICDEDDKIKYKLSVENGILKLNEIDGRKWYDFIGVFVDSREVTLYLPEKNYSGLTVRASSGGFSCCDGKLVFENIDAKTSSGGIELSLNAAKSIKAESASGRILIGGSEANRVDVKTSSGEVVLDNVIADEISLASLSGRIRLNDTSAKVSANIKSTSGSINLESFDAPEIVIKSTSGSVYGNLLSGKIFDVKTTSGGINCPESDKDGGVCRVETTSGSVKFKISD